MKNHFENLFIRELLDSEFAFAKTKIEKSKLNSINSKINFKKSSQFQILDLFELNTSLKQLVRILFSLKYSKTFRKSNFIVYIWCLNPFILNLANSFINEYNLSNHIIALNYFPSVLYTNETRKKKYLFVLGDPWTQQPKNMLDSHFLKNDIFLVSTLNFKLERHEPGFYKIQNDLGDYKKLLVLLVLFESILHQTKEKIERRKVIKKLIFKQKNFLVKQTVADFKNKKFIKKNKK